MGSQSPFKERLAGWGSKLRDLWLRLKNSLSQAHSQEFDLESIKTWLAETAEKVRERLQALKAQETKLTWSDVRGWLHQHGRNLLIYLALPILGIILLMVIQKQTQQQVDTMYLRQAQLTTIQNMVQKSKLSSLMGDPSPPLNDNEVETIRIMLQNRGISPNILRLNLTRGGASELEVQADQVPFGQWIIFLDEAAQRWDLFPVDMNVSAGDAPEMVSLRALLQQTTEGN